MALLDVGFRRFAAHVPNERRAALGRFMAQKKRRYGCAMLAAWHQQDAAIHQLSGSLSRADACEVAWLEMQVRRRSSTPRGLAYFDCALGRVLELLVVSLCFRFGRRP